MTSSAQEDLTNGPKKKKPAGIPPKAGFFVSTDDLMTVVRKPAGKNPAPRAGQRRLRVGGRDLTNGQKTRFDQWSKKSRPGTPPEPPVGGAPDLRRQRAEFDHRRESLTSGQSSAEPKLRRRRDFCLDGRCSRIRKEEPAGKSRPGKAGREKSFGKSRPGNAGREKSAGKICRPRPRARRSVACRAAVAMYNGRDLTSGQTTRFRPMVKRSRSQQQGEAPRPAGPRIRFAHQAKFDHEI